MANQLTDSETKMLRERAHRLAGFLFSSEDVRIYVHGHGKGWQTLDEVTELFEADLSELLLAAKEKACKFACAACEEGEPLHPPPTGKVGWWHDLGNGLRMKCYATEIRNSCWGDLFKGQ